MNKLLNIQKYLFYGLIAICFLYSIFARHFAQIGAELPFLNFPVFIGEWVLFFYLIAVCYIKLKKQKLFIPVNIYFLLYFIWVIFMAAVGYFTYGPVALRISAMFYYLLFFIISYHLFSKSFFDQKFIVISIIIIVLSYLFEQSYEKYVYFNFCHIMLLLVLVLSLKNRTLKIIFFLITLGMLPFQSLMSGSRSSMLAFVIAGIFLLGLSLSAKVFSRKIRLLILMMIIITIAPSVMNEKVKLKLYSFLDGKEASHEFSMVNYYIQQYENRFELKDIKPKIYFQEDDVLFYKSNDRENIIKESVDLQINLSFDRALKILDDNIKKLDYRFADTPVYMDFQKKLREEYYNVIINTIDQNPEDRVASAESLNKKMLEEISKFLNEEYTLFQQRNHEVSTKTSASSPSIGREGSSVSALNSVEKENIEHSNVEYINNISADFLSLINKNVEKNVDISFRNAQTEHSNIHFRLHIWRDMIRELFDSRALFGINWGKPQRSKSVEMLNIAHGEWSRDGWITPHNSFLHMIYRAGIFGFILVCLIGWYFIELLLVFIRNNSIKGFLLMTIFVYFFVLSNFLVILEFPYNAIPVWSLAGAVGAYAFKKEQAG